MVYPDPMIVSPFEYHVQTRSPAAYLSLGAGLFAFYMGLRSDASVLTLLAVTACLGFIVLRLAVNPKRGFRFQSDRVEIFAPGLFRAIPVHEIACLRAEAVGHDHCRWVIVLRDGTTLPLPGAERVPAQRIAAGFAQRGISSVR